MGLRVQICPIGFEFKRVLAGLKYRPPNVIYLLSSKIEIQDYAIRNGKYQLDEKLAKLSQEFTDKLEKHLKPQLYMDIKVQECSFTNYRKVIEQLCDIIKEIFDYESKNEVIDEIWFNIGTATKLFVSAAQYIASFRADKIHLFYVRAHNYTINELLLEESSKEDVEKLFREEGMSYSKVSLDKDYSLEKMPIVPSQRLTDQANNILKILLTKSETQWVSLATILSEIERDLEGNPRDQTKSMKMKYHHYIKQLKNNRLIEEDSSQKRHRQYKLTEEGIIYALIISKIPLK